MMSSDKQFWVQISSMINSLIAVQVHLGSTSHDSSAVHASEGCRRFDVSLFVGWRIPKIAKLVYNSNNYGLWYL